MLPFSLMTGIVLGSDEADLRDRARRLSERRPTSTGCRTRHRRGSSARSTRPTEQLLELREAGVDRVMCQHLLHDDLDAVALLGEELAPRVR